MLDTLTSTNHTDFRQRYLNTYGWFNTGTRKLLVYVSNVSDREVVFSDKQGVEYNVFRDSGLEFEFIPVDRGWFNTINGPLYLCRVPARQWHRGICKSNTNIYRQDASGTFVGANVGIKLLSDIFENTLTPHECLQNAAGVALSKHFAMVPKGKFMFYDQKVGEVDHSGARYAITLTNPIVKQEVSDLIRRNNYPMDIK
jgi:hypothetical protein